MKTREFPSADGLRITADVYSVADARNVIVLCHRSHFNRGEYKEVAPRLNGLGFTCVAIDQRSGMNVLGTTNETAQRAKDRGFKTGYLAARPDVEAAVDYAHALNGGSPIVVLGSSYSASIALLIASESVEKLAAIVAFSPGEHLKGVRLADAVAKIHKPTLVLAAKSEVPITTELLRDANRKYVTLHAPTSEGAHGARSLWAKTEGYEEYWAALEEFLDAHA